MTPQPAEPGSSNRRPRAVVAAQALMSLQVALLAFLACVGGLILLFFSFVYNMSDPRPDDAASDDAWVIPLALVSAGVLATMAVLYAALEARLGSGRARLRTAVVAFAPPLYVGVVVAELFAVQWQVESGIGPPALYLWAVAISTSASVAATVCLVAASSRRWFDTLSSGGGSDDRTGS